MDWIERIFNEEEIARYVPGKDLARFISEESVDNSDFYKALKEKAFVLSFNKLEADAHEGEPSSLEQTFLTELVDFEVLVSAIESLGVTFFKLEKADEIVLPFYRDFLFGYAITQVAVEREQQIQAFLPKLTRLLETFQVMQCQTFCSIFLGNSHESAESLREDNATPRFLCLAPLTIIESLLSHFKQGRLKLVDHHLQPLSFSILMAQVFARLKEFEAVENRYPFHKLKTPYEEIHALFKKYQGTMKDKG